MPKRKAEKCRKRSLDDKKKKTIPMIRHFGVVSVIVLFLLLTATTTTARPSPPAPCGTLDLNSPLTQHCFPADGSHHFVCCVDIATPENELSPHGNRNPLLRAITAASNATSYSWCTCSEEICEEQLKGRVEWNMNGRGWKGYLPPMMRRGGMGGGGGGGSEL